MTKWEELKPRNAAERRNIRMSRELGMEDDEILELLRANRFSQKASMVIAVFVMLFNFSILGFIFYQLLFVG